LQSDRDRKGGRDYPRHARRFRRSRSDGWRCHRARRLFLAQLQRRPRHHRQGVGGAPLSDDRGDRFCRHRRDLEPCSLEAGRRGHPQRLGLVRLPASMSAREAMAIGTAGYTAMLAVMALEGHGLTPERGPVAVTGAAGGVGSVAIAILAKRGFSVSAVTGRPQEADYLKGLGAAEIVERKELAGPPKPLAKERWAGAVDSAGSTTLANLLSMTRYGGAVAACGLAAGMDLPTSVAPFILRGVC